MLKFKIYLPLSDAMEKNIQRFFYLLLLQGKTIRPVSAYQSQCFASFRSANAVPVAPFVFALGQFGHNVPQFWP